MKTAYPQVRYSKDKDGVLQSVTLTDASQEKEYAKWVDSPAKLGFESHPALPDVDKPKVKAHPDVKAKTVKPIAVAVKKGKKNVRH